MEARTDLIQLKADLKDEENRTNMFALEVCELTSDKKRLQDENFELVKQLDDTRCELGYERTSLIKLAADLKDVNEFSRKARLAAFDLDCDNKKL